MGEHILLLEELGISLALGGVIGLQRQRAGSDVGGIRTFPILAAIGTFLAFLSPPGTRAWVLLGGMAAVTALLINSNHMRPPERRDPGMTTEAAALLTVLIGATVHIGPLEVAIAMGIVLLGILELKTELHAFAERLQERDISAILQFGLVAFIIFPVLPTENMVLVADDPTSPFNTFNPQKTWKMVVLVAGMGLAGYVSLKLVGARYGMLLSGFLGGLVSSTATTMTFARRSKENEALSTIGAVVVMLACTMLFFRVAVEAAVVHAPMTPVLAARLAVMLGANLLVMFYLWRRAAGESRAGAPPEVKNPCDLRTAITFGVMYSAILMGLALCKRYIGDSGLYVAALVSGLTDMDAITLSSAGMASRGEITNETASNLVVVATIANTVFKGTMASALAAAAMKRQLWLGFGAIILSGLGCLVWFNWEELLGWVGGA